MENKFGDILTKYRHPNTPEGIRKVKEIFLRNKHDIIESMKKHPCYNGNYQIVQKVEFDRDVSRYAVMCFIDKFVNDINVDKVLLKKTTPAGKTFKQCRDEAIQNLPKMVKADDLTKLQKIDADLEMFDGNGVYKPSISNKSRFMRTVNMFRTYTESTMSQEFINELSSLLEGINVVAGMKTSKALWRIVMQYGFDEKVVQPKFTPYGDLINPLRRKLTYVISVNPIDYLLMSNGNTWTSCHTINKTNGDSGYHGAYCGGTFSYMLDSTSIVTYVIAEDETEHPELCKKIYRNMMHWDNDGILLQGRVYPQAKDGAVDLYAKMRHLMQKAVCEMKGVEYINTHCGNDTWIKPNNSHRINFVVSKGNHYRDYNNFSDCNWTKIRGHNDPTGNYMVIGYNPVCPCCGEELESNSREFIACGRCR